MQLELNVDLGELPDEPDELYRLATVANVACGGHAGDESSMERACRACVRYGTRLAAHPSYPDRSGFGRRSLAWPRDELTSSWRGQLEELRGVARRVGVHIEALKPHGALYHDANRRPELAADLLEVSRGVLGDVSVVGPPEGELRRAALARGLGFAREGFADRGYDERGELVPRARPGALLSGEQAAEAASLLARSGRFDTLCVHGDAPGALDTARAVRSRLEREGFLRGRGPC